MPKNKLQKALAGRKPDIKKSRERTSKQMKEIVEHKNYGEKFKRTTLYIDYNDDLFLNELSKKLHKQLGVKVTKSLLIEYSLKFLREADEKNLLEEVENAAKRRAIGLL
jgi:hypothetical protein